MRGGRRGGRRRSAARRCRSASTSPTPTSCAAAVDAAVERFGRIDILVNNAFHDGDFTRFVDADFDSWRTTMDVNLWGTLQLTQRRRRTA